MDNSKVLKPIIGPQESAESKKKESSKKKKALIVSALAFLISTGTIATSVAVVKANMPKLEIKFDQWFVDSFDKQSMQVFIDQNRLSEQSMFKQLPGYVDQKAKDQNVKNADAIATAKFTDKVPNDKSNKFPPGVYIELTAEDEYSFKYQADLSLEENEQQTKQLSALTKQEEKVTKYFVSSDKSKLYILVYERPVDNDITNEVEDLQTFNDYDITNVGGAFDALNNYIFEKPRRYTKTEFSEQFKDASGNDKPSPTILDIFYEKLIGLERRYVLTDPAPSYDINSDTVTIYLNNKRSNFNFEIPSNYTNNISYDNVTGKLTLSNFKYHNLTEIKLDTLQADIQNYIKEQTRRYTREEFQSQFGDEELRKVILDSVNQESKDPTLPKPLGSEITNPDEPGNGDGETEIPTPEPETPPKPEPGKPKISNLFLRGNDLVIAFECDEGYKYQDIYVDETNKDDSIYSFNTQTDELTVKGLKYFTEYTVTNTAEAIKNLDDEIIKISNEYTVSEFTAFATGADTQQQCKNLIAKALKANNKTFNVDWITNLTVTPHNISPTNATLTIQFDTDYKKYKTNETEQAQIDSEKSTLDINLTFFKEVQINNLKSDIQLFIDTENDTKEKYTVDDFESKVNEQQENDLKQKIKEIVEANVQGVKDVSNFIYSKADNKLKFNVTIPKYDKFPSNTGDIEYTLKRKDDTGNTIYEVTVSNLEYWFDLEFTSEALEETWTNTQDTIDSYNIDLHSEDNGTSYEKDKQKIFDAISETKLTNGVQIKQYVNLDSTNVTRTNTDFNVDLSAINEKNAIKVRDAKGIEVENGKIVFDKDTKMLKLNNFVYGTPLDCFVIDDKTKTILNLTEKGTKKNVLKFPSGYPKIMPVSGAKFKNNNVIEKVYIPEGVEEINPKTGRKDWFMLRIKNLIYLKLPSTLKKIFGAFNYSYKLKNIEFPTKNNFSSANDMQSVFGALGLEKAIMPKNFTYISNSLLAIGETDSVKPDTPNVLKYVISEATTASTLGFGNQKNLEAICLLASSLKSDTALNSSPMFCLEYHPKATIYVINQNVKKAIEDDVKAHIKNNQKWTNPKIEVMPDLKQKLITAGKLPSDW